MTIYASQDNDPTELAAKFLGGMAVKIPLQFGDFVFSGSGWGDEPISVCIERKRIRDLINSLVLGKRLVQQFRDARTAHQVLYLFIEGLYREGPTNGLVETIHHDNWHVLNCGTNDKPILVEFSRLSNSLESVAVVQGVQLRWTSGPQQTAKRLLDLYRWWQRSPEE